MNWCRVKHLLKALDRRITDNIACRGERWVHDPEETPDRNQQGPGQSAPRAEAGQARPPMHAVDQKGKAKIAMA